MSSGPDGLGNAMAESHHHDNGGNYGPVIGILFLIAILTGGALFVARYLVGPRAFQRTGYDLEAFVQRKCAVCLGGGAGKPAAPPVKRTCHLQPEAVEEVEELELPVEEVEAQPVEEVEEPELPMEEPKAVEEVEEPELPVEEEEEEEEEESAGDP